MRRLPDTAHRADRDVVRDAGYGGALHVASWTTGLSEPSKPATCASVAATPTIATSAKTGSASVGTVVGAVVETVVETVVGIVVGTVDGTFDGTAAGVTVARRAWTPRRIALWSAAGLLAAVALWWLFDRLTHVDVTDARIASHMVLISSRVPGWIVDVPVQTGQRVRKGDVLVRIDDREARARLAESVADVAVVQARIGGAQTQVTMVGGQTASRVTGQRSRLDAARSALASASAALSLASAEHERARTLRGRKLLSEGDFDAKHTAFQRAEQARAQAQADVAAMVAGLAESQAATGETVVKHDDLKVLLGERERLAAVRDRLAATLDDHAVKSPLDGLVDESFINNGEYVQTGQRMLVLHRPGDLYVKANVKETDVRYVHVGNAAEVSVDAVPDKVYAGHVTRVSGAVNSSFSLLPNPNPGGNFTKITQRVEVRVDLDDRDPGLKPGMMVEVRFRK